MKIKKFKCNKCNNKISYRTALYGSKLCVSCSRKGKKRKPFSKEWIEKISESMKGKKKSEEHKINIGKSLKGKKQNKKTIEQRRKKLIGQKRTKEQRKRLAIACKKHWANPKEREKISGKNNYNYIHGQGYGNYSREFTITLRKEIRKRDNLICQYCGMAQEEHYKKYKRDLEIHHIDYNKLNCSKTNLITTCKLCNMRANFNRDYWFAYYTYIMENKI